MISVLSPLATPFHPHSSAVEESFDVVYSDGMPTATFFAGEHEVLGNIQEEHFEDAFPPDAAEAAELDACVDFVSTMAFLGLMEEQEELSRQNYSFARTKRWSARREAGLQGRPHPARPSSRLGRASRSNSGSGEMSLIPYDFAAHSYPPNYDSRVYARQVVRSDRHTTKSGKAMHGHSSHSIQQPRKSTFKNSTRLW